MGESVMLDSLLGWEISAQHIIIVLELILAVYSVALALNTERKTLRTVHLVSTALWIVLALSNIFI